jgi:Fur family ferric uptake transcriptional regulator
MTFAPRREPLDFKDIDDVAAEFRKRGGRLTLPRRLVLEALFAAEGPISAEYIASGGHGRRQRLEPTSVYRNLERLEALGVVRHLHLGQGPGLYTLTSRREVEYLVCDRCGRITTVEATQLNAVRDIVREQVGYHAHFDHYPLHGLCDQCASHPAFHLHEDVLAED